jgi:alanine racemase
MGGSGGVLTIDLEAIAANWHTLKRRLGPDTTCAAVVKADAYGLGAARVAPCLYDAGCRDFFVATVDEALSLRRPLPAAALYVLAGVDRDSATELAASGVVPVLNHLGQLEAWQAAARALHRPLPALLHLDTGMNRLGLPADELSRLIAEPERLDRVAVRHLMSHLISSEQPDASTNDAQRARFETIRATLRPLLGDKPASLANSSGIFLGPAFHYSMVRPGVALYGVNPVPNAPNPMAEVVRLTATIVQVRRVDRGETVGYGATHRLARPSRLATVSVGYADGYLRSASNRASAHIGGVSVPLVGRVSMDLITFDVTDVPEALAQAGASLELLGGAYPVDKFAADAGTIGYEVLTSLGRRYARRYGGPTP